jgi:hypothetical protein
VSLTKLVTLVAQVAVVKLLVAVEAVQEDLETHLLHPHHKATMVETLKLKLNLMAAEAAVEQEQ